jgi:anti-sigma regulatory factor (Ser/Thr protein kinase)
MNERTFPNHAASVALARRFTHEALDDVDLAVSEEVVLMVSELVSNSVRHAASDFTVAVDRRGDEITVNVTDGGSGRPALRAPALTDQSGRGLRIVQAFADSWGVTDSDGAGKTVWFRVSMYRRESVDPGLAERPATRLAARDPSQ